MSGSAAIAGARRRRASTDNVSTGRDTKQDEPIKTNSQESKSYSLVQVIQMHEARLKRLEEKIMGVSDDNKKDSINNMGFNNDSKIIERIDKIESDISAMNKYSKDSKDSKDSNNIEVINNIEKSINNSILELDNKLKTDKMDNHNNFDNIHNKISNIEKNLEKINTSISVEKILTELNELKTIVIKSQLLSLETANKLSSLECLSDKENVDDVNMTSTDNLLFLESLLKNEYNVDLSSLNIDLTDENVNLELDNIIDISSIVSVDNNSEFTLEEVINNKDNECNEDNEDNECNKDNECNLDSDKIGQDKL